MVSIQCLIYRIYQKAVKCEKDIFDENSHNSVSRERMIISSSYTAHVNQNMSFLFSVSYVL